MKELLNSILTAIIIPTTYLLGMWLSITAGFGLLAGDLLTGAGISSSLALFYIFKGYYMKELHANVMNERELYVKSDEAKRK